MGRSSRRRRERIEPVDRLDALVVDHRASAICLVSIAARISSWTAVARPS
jgi:hypothetical protein